MKVAFVIQDLFSQGAQYATALLIRGFISKGYSVDLIVCKAHNDFLAEGKKPFFVPYETNWIHLKSRHARHNIWELRKYLLTTDAKAVISMNSPYDPALAIASLGLSHRPRMYMVEHGISFALDHAYKSRASYPWYSKTRLMRRAIWTRFEGCFAVAQEVASELVRVYGDDARRISVVYNPVVDNQFKVKSAKSATHPWLKKKDVFTFISAGALCDIKGHKLALEAIRVLRDRGVKARLIVYGRGELLSHFEYFVKNNHLEDIVSFPGFSDCLPAEVRAADCYLCTSKAESFGIAIVEALACGTPVISCDCPCGPREILDGGKYGVLVPPNDHIALANAMERAAREGLPEVLSQSWQRFSCEAITSLYEKALGLEAVQS